MADGADGLPAKVAGGVGEVAPDEALRGVGGARSSLSTIGSSADGPPLPRRGKERAAATHYSEALAGRIVARVAGGESVPKACRGPGMPHPSTVYAWARAEPRFARALAAAHQDARRAKLKAQRAAAAARWARGRDPRGRWSLYTPELGEEVCWRIIEGRTLTMIGADPEMPCAGTILNWAKTIPEFEDRYAQAKAMQADVMFDAAHDEAMAATPANVWAQKLKVDSIFKRVARMKPRKYCERVVAAEAIVEARAEDDPDRGGLTVIIKRPEDITEEEHENARLTEAGYFDRRHKAWGR